MAYSSDSYTMFTIGAYLVAYFQSYSYSLVNERTLKKKLLFFKALLDLEFELFYILNYEMILKIAAIIKIT